MILFFFYFFLYFSEIRGIMDKVLYTCVTRGYNNK